MRRRPTRPLLAVVICALVALGVAAVLLTRPPTPIDRARDLLADDSGFETARESGVTFIHVARLLRESAESCRKKHADSQDCADLFAGTAYAQVSAVRVLGCTRPGVFDAREQMRRYLDGLHAGTHPPVPEVVACR